MPGVPDIYQGAELWDLSMVDPDNRRPVDYGARERALAAIGPALDGGRATAMAGLLGSWQDGRIKLAVIQVLLGLRRAQPELFASGTYTPLAVEGPDADAICAFERGHAGQSLLVAVARYPGRRAAKPLRGDTHLLFSRRSRLARHAHWHAFRGRDAALRHSLFATLPVAVLVQARSRIDPAWWPPAAVAR